MVAPPLLKFQGLVCYYIMEGWDWN